MVELAYTLISKVSPLWGEGSSPSFDTMNEDLKFMIAVEEEVARETLFLYSVKAKLEKEIKYLEDHIKKISNCKTCGGDRMKTLGLFQCTECGLEGRCPWGG